MQKPSRTLVLTLIACATGTLAACGGGGGGSSSGGSTPYSKYQGVWEEKCEQIIEGSTVQGSFIPRFAFADKSIKLVESYYSSANCSGNEIATLSYPTYTFAIAASSSSLVDQVDIRSAGGPVEGSGVARREKHPDGSFSWAIPFEAGSPFYAATDDDPETIKGTATFQADLKGFTLTEAASQKPLVTLTKRL